MLLQMPIRSLKILVKLQRKVAEMGVRISRAWKVIKLMKGKLIWRGKRIFLGMGFKKWMTVSLFLFSGVILNKRIAKQIIFQPQIMATLNRFFLPKKKIRSNHFNFLPFLNTKYTRWAQKSMTFEYFTQKKD